MVIAGYIEEFTPPPIPSPDDNDNWVPNRKPLKRPNRNPDDLDEELVRVLKKKFSKKLPPGWKPRNYTHERYNQFNPDYVKMEDLMIGLDWCSKSKAVGEDGLSITAFKQGVRSVDGELPKTTAAQANFLKQMHGKFKTMDIPPHFLEAKGIFLAKTPGSDLMSDGAMRPISITSHAFKCWEKSVIEAMARLDCDILATGSY